VSNPLPQSQPAEGSARLFSSAGVPYTVPSALSFALAEDVRIYVSLLCQLDARVPSVLSSVRSIDSFAVRFPFCTDVPIVDDMLPAHHPPHADKIGVLSNALP
jgi:hypothetical protein